MDICVSEYKGSKGGTLISEKAIIKNGEVPVVLAAVCSHSGDAEKRMLRDLGAWFQNSVIPIAVRKFTGKLPDEEKIFDLVLQTKEFNQWLDVCRDGVFSFILCLGDSAVIRGWNSYTLQSYFGRSVLAVHEDYSEPVKLEPGASILITDGKLRVREERDYAECLFSSAPGDLEKAVREVGSAAGTSSFIFLKFN